MEEEILSHSSKYSPSLASKVLPTQSVLPELGTGGLISTFTRSPAQWLRSTVTQLNAAIEDEIKPVHSYCVQV